jgi:hypothetical protein
MSVRQNTLPRVRAQGGLDSGRQGDIVEHLSFARAGGCPNHNNGTKR